MSKLILNEWIKLFTRKRIIVLMVLVLLSGFAAVAAVKLDDHNHRTSWQETYQSEIDMYLRQLARYPEFDETEWENELSYQADLMRWNNQIQKYQFCLDNSIPTWDWRMEILEEYFRNLLLMDCVRAGWNSEDISAYFDFSTDTDLAQVEEANENLMIYVINNDYQTYNKEQLQNAEERLIELQEMTWLEDAEKTLAMAENDVAMWERYVQYNTPPYAADNWVSVAIERIHEHQALYIYYTHLSPEDPMMQPEKEEELRSRLENYEASIAKDMFSLENRTVSYDIQKDVYTEESTYLNFLDLSVTSSIVIVLLGIVLGALMIAGEFRYDTIKQLVIYPYKRKTILRAKFHAISLLLFALCLVLLIVNLILGFLLFPSQLEMPIFTTYFFGNVYWLPYIVFILIKYLFVFVQAVVMVTMAVMLAVLTRSTSISSAVSLGAYLILPAVMQLVYPALDGPFIFKYILFGNLEWSQYLINELAVPYAPWWVSLIVVFVWWFVMRRISYFVFKHREVRE